MKRVAGLVEEFNFLPKVPLQMAQEADVYQ